MKKALFIAAASMITILLLFTSQKVQAMAADPVISVDVSEVTVSIKPTDSEVALGDFAVELKIANNSGYGASGIGIHYDKTNFEPVMMNTDHSPEVSCYYQLGPAASGLNCSVLVNREKGVFGFTSSGARDNDVDGTIVTVFLARKTNAVDPNAIPYVGTNVHQFARSTSVDIENYQEPTPYIDPTAISSPVTVERHFSLEYRLGDANGDGLTNMKDANILASILNNSTSIGASVAENRARALTDLQMDGLFHNGYEIFPDTFIFDVIDINGDGVISSADRSQISNFNMADILGVTPEELGCVSGIGEIDYYLYTYTETVIPAP